MKTIPLIVWSALLLLAVSVPAHGATFVSGSTGADGPLNITNNTVLTLPPDGIFNFTTIDIGGSATLRFSRNEMNTPVYLLATSNVTIRGTIDVSGYRAETGFGGQGGPGGFDGGNPASSGDPPGDGYGPGAGAGGSGLPGSPSAARGGAYATTTSYSSSNRYGNLLLQPLVGGSGGGGASGGGGGGGGAILIASTTGIFFGPGGRIEADGGYGSGNAGQGSGGAIRLVAPKVSGGIGTLEARGTTSTYAAGNGRIRVDTLDRESMFLNFYGKVSLGANMTVFLSPVPRLDIVEAAGRPIPFGTNRIVVVQLPVDAPTNQTVKVQATDFIGQVSVEVAVTPEAGPGMRFSGVIDMGATNQAAGTIDVVIPRGIQCRINAWSR